MVRHCRIQPCVVERAPALGSAKSKRSRLFLAQHNTVWNEHWVKFAPTVSFAAVTPNLFSHKLWRMEKKKEKKREREKRRSYKTQNVLGSYCEDSYNSFLLLNYYSERLLQFILMLLQLSWMSCYYNVIKKKIKKKWVWL